MAIRLGITGGIGSGKSFVAKLLTDLFQIPVYTADDECKRLMNLDVEIKKGLTELIGENAYLPDGTLNKPCIANYLFASQDHVRQVNSVVHPRVKTDVLRWATEHSQLPIIAFESAILFEAGFRETVDIALTVYAPVEVRIERASKRDHASREKIQERIRMQMSDEEKVARSEYVIVNDGETPLIPQLLNLVITVLKR